jgi:histidine triad (HIT) family protein
MKKDGCIFCMIANGDIPSATLYEDDDVRVILDRSPATRGHALVLPKVHCRNIYDADEAILQKMITVASKTAKAMKEKLHCDGLNIVQNNEEVAGQTVFHLHIHMIPRYKEDGVNLTWAQTEPTEKDLEEIAQTISKDL